MSTTLELAPDPQSVRTARAWVAGELTGLGRHDLVDAAELGISELVTNAILHADPPITVRVGGTPTHPRVEVHDTSVVPPRLRDMTHEERLLATVGRGLAIVAMYSSTWGAEISNQGKVVWFEPVAEPSLPDFDLDFGLDLDDLEGEGVSTDPLVGTAEGQGRSGADVFSLADAVERRLEGNAAPTELIRVQLVGMPVRVFAAYRLWYEELRREVRLLALNHAGDYPAAQQLSDLSLQVEQERRQAQGVEALDQAVADGRDRVDLDYLVPPSTPDTMRQLREVLTDIDVFCREQRLLTPPATQQHAALRDWYLGEFERQGRGEPPTPWPGSYEPEPDGPSEVGPAR